MAGILGWGGRKLDDLIFGNEDRHVSGSFFLFGQTGQDQTSCVNLLADGLL